MQIIKIKNGILSWNDCDYINFTIYDSDSDSIHLCLNGMIVCFLIKDTMINDVIITDTEHFIKIIYENNSKFLDNNISLEEEKYINNL
jgi:hypothetical protein